MKYILLVSFLSVLCPCIVSCERDTDNLSLTDFKVPAGCGWKFAYLDVNIHYHNIIIINSQEEFAKSFYCELENIPSIDFSKKTMLVFLSNYNGRVITKKLKKENKFVYKWDIEIERINVGYCEFAVLVPKLPKNVQVEATVIFKY